MAIERTFSMIKPDATRRNLTGAITQKLEEAGLRVVASKRVWMSKREAEGFYAVHKARPFFGELVETMTSGPTIVQVLEGENAIAANREAEQKRSAQPKPTPHTVTETATETVAEEASQPEQQPEQVTVTETQYATETVVVTEQGQPNPQPNPNVEGEPTTTIELGQQQ